MLLRSYEFRLMCIWRTGLLGILMQRECFQLNQPINLLCKKEMLLQEGMLLVLVVQVDVGVNSSGLRFGKSNLPTKLKCSYGVLHITAFLLEEFWPGVDKIRYHLSSSQKAR